MANQLKVEEIQKLLAVNLKEYFLTCPVCQLKVEFFWYNTHYPRCGQILDQYTNSRSSLSLLTQEETVSKTKYDEAISKLNKLKEKYDKIKEQVKISPYGAKLEKVKREPVYGEPNKTCHFSSEFDNVQHCQSPTRGQRLALFYGNRSMVICRLSHISDITTHNLVLNYLNYQEGDPQYFDTEGAICVGCGKIYQQHMFKFVPYGVSIITSADYRYAHDLLCLSGYSSKVTLKSIKVNYDSISNNPANRNKLSSAVDIKDDEYTYKPTKKSKKDVATLESPTTTTTTTTTTTDKSTPPPPSADKSAPPPNRGRKSNKK